MCGLRGILRGAVGLFGLIRFWGVPIDDQSERLSMQSPLRNGPVISGPFLSPGSAARLPAGEV